MSLSLSVLQVAIDSGLWKLWRGRGPEGPLIPSSLKAMREQ